MIGSCAALAIALGASSPNQGLPSPPSAAAPGSTASRDCRIVSVLRCRCLYSGASTIDSYCAYLGGGTCAARGWPSGGGDSLVGCAGCQRLWSWWRSSKRWWVVSIPVPSQFTRSRSKRSAPRGGGIDVLESMYVHTCSKQSKDSKYSTLPYLQRVVNHPASSCHACIPNLLTFPSLGSLPLSRSNT